MLHKEKLILQLALDLKEKTQLEQGHRQTGQLQQLLRSQLIGLAVLLQPQEEQEDLIGMTVQSLML